MGISQKKRMVLAIASRDRERSISCSYEFISNLIEQGQGLRNSSEFEEDICRSQGTKVPDLP
jgi:hypothetical protein